MSSQPLNYKFKFNMNENFNLKGHTIYVYDQHHEKITAELL